MSEFYQQRRTSIKDGVALVAFILGWFAAGPFAWPYISEAFDQGDPAKGVLRFFGVVFVGGLAFGAVGLVLGHAAGHVWERMHRRWRVTHQPIDRDEEDRVRAAAAVPRTERLPLPPIRLDVGEIDVDAYRALLEAAAVTPPDRARAAVALIESISIGAWTGERLIGVARIVTDTAHSAMLADLVVHPEFQRRGLGRMLLAKAYDATPRGELGIIAPRGMGAFFESVGADRAVAAFVLRRPVRLRVG